jgi:hypothetical protein
MSISKGKHLEKEINEIRCRVVESTILKDRADFLKELLEHNGYEVHVEEEPVKPPPPPKPASTEEGAETVEVAEEPLPEPEPTFVIGVTDIIFNPVVAVYNRILRTLDGKHVTADYWNQKTSKAEPNYWDRGKKEWL